jgi:hypothetical protein
MAAEVNQNRADQPDKEPVRARDATKPWKRQFFECRDVGPEPAFNGAGFWRRPVHGISVKER